MYQQKSVVRFETEVKSTIKIQIPANLKLSLSHLVIKALCACSHSPLSILQTLPKGSWHLIRRYLGRMVLLESCLYLQNDILVYKGWQRISTGRWIIRKCKRTAHKEHVLLITSQLVFSFMFSFLKNTNSAATASLPNASEFHFPNCYPGIRTDLIIIINANRIFFVHCQYYSGSCCGSCITLQY